MTTASYTAPNKHDTDAEFRAWGLAFSNALATLPKLVKTSDTGQINWATVTRAAVNTMAGYEIYYLNDAKHSTAPIYLKISYGTGYVSNAPHIRVNVGTASDGAGNVTGSVSATNIPCVVGLAGVSTAYPHYMCAVEGCFWFTYAQGASGHGTFAVMRTCDATGTPDDYGISIVAWGHLTGSAGTASQRATSLSYRYGGGSPASVNPVTVAAGAYLVKAPYGMTAADSVMPNGDFPAYLAFGGFPDMRPLNFGCGVFSTHVPDGTSFSTTLIGSTAHTYIVGGTFVPFADGTLSFARIWE